MRKTLARSAIAALALTAVLAVAFAATPAFPHEERANGGVRFVVGWGDEPAYTGFKNSVQVTVSEADGAPVTDLGDTLKLEVSKGAEKVTLPLEANFRVGGFGTPGDYRAWLTPTRPGTYTFRLTGTVRGQSVDESFTSSETTFNEVEDVANIQFPAKDPSPGQLATRIDREIRRLQSRTDAAEAALRKAEGRVDSARAVAVVAVVAGGLGLLAATAALAGGRRARREPRPPGARRKAGAQREESLSR